MAGDSAAALALMYINYKDRDLEYAEKTNKDGSFEIANVPQSASGYTLKISKPAYLYRELKDITFTKNVQLGTVDAPIAMWAGDLVINGTQDNTINMSDVIQIAKHFNSVSGNAKYIANDDLNEDESINMSDVIIIAKHFGKTSSDYIQ